MSVAVNEVVDPLDMIRDPTPGIKDAVADPGFRWVAVELEYFNRTDDVVDMSLAYRVDLHTSSGLKAELWALQRRDMPERGRAIPPNASLRGWLAFAVPEGDALASLLLSGGEIGTDPVVVEL